MAQPLLVTAEEAGQKLLQFLARRFDEPQGVLHRWIRTGQVRINGGRAKPFDRVDFGDEVRVPPFAGGGAQAAAPVKEDRSLLPPIVAETDELIVFCKPAGLPVHPGTGHTDSLTARLEKSFAGAPFMPAPVHRLDRDTSGLLLVGKTYAAVRRLSDALAAHAGIEKDYLAWAHGECPWLRPARLEDRLSKRSVDGGRERMAVGTPRHAPDGKEASLTVRRLELRQGNSLLLIRLHTGRTHQIRAQLAARGFPLIGDVKYGGPACEGGLKLHAARLRVGGSVFTAPPPWSGVWRASLPQEEES
ncbi:MAG TPA: RluA family pseudouridine synthase [Candidatus Bilophila faecipullorum]|uniref:RluA family pseudouridine synthase n=4 Tax=Bilophila TaxID=35832 RepID=A0A9D1U9P7_9BACT|nr:RluA family pseudouridine synthase [uncultured Bilophila sp.]HIW78420.1 RluA family pseudouridine synthase [Candidatus Bilophila faecipullorum]